jgi:hypothetical protein
MRKLIVLTFLLITTLSSFSQTDTTTPKTNISTKQIDTTEISLKIWMAKLVIKDIIKGDGCQFELKETQKKLIKTEEREKEKDLHIALLEEKDKNNNFMLGKKDEQLSTSQELNNKLHKELKSERRNKLFWKITTCVGIFTTSYFALTK